MARTLLTVLLVLALALFAAPLLGCSDDGGEPGSPASSAGGTETGTSSSAPASATSDDSAETRPPEAVTPEQARERIQKLLADHPVRFEAGTAYLDQGAEALLDPLAQFLRDHPEIRVRVSTTVKSLLPAEENLALSQRMAERVVRLLVKRGVADGQLEPLGYGNVRPLPPENTPEARKANPNLWVVVLSNEE